LTPRMEKGDTDRQTDGQTDRRTETDERGKGERPQNPVRQTDRQVDRPLGGGREARHGVMHNGAAAARQAETAAARHRAQRDGREGPVR
jgi:hypothetical protein